MENFLSFGLDQQIVQSLVNLKFIKPTPIQAQVIPIALEGKDILGSAQTGTGKTGAFGIPLVSKLIKDPSASALVMAPTRELALQVIKMLESIIGVKNRYIRSALLIGGESIGKQFQQLRHNPRLIVGTPGRINDHLTRGSLKLNEVKFLVLDETDRMLDMGFLPQIDKIVKLIPNNRQTLLFSATLPKNIVTLSDKYLNKPVRISLTTTAVPLANLKQDILHVAESDKYNQLINNLEKRDGSIIVFVKTKFSAEKMAKRLRQERHDADCIHGGLSHSSRARSISDFRNRKYRILVATDIAARGLDIDHIRHVINYDLPQCPEDYIHRIGRTARAGTSGAAICFITPADKGKWGVINRLINPKQ
jgi:ATP-dependent RNA helicase DeaD